MKKQIVELSEEQLDVIAKIADESINRVIGGDVSHDPKLIEEFYEFVYTLSGLKKPQVFIKRSPEEAVDFAKANGAVDCSFLDGVGLCSDSGWTANFMAYEAIGVDLHDIDDWVKWKKIINTGIFASLLFEKVAIAIIRPSVCKTNDAGNLHNDKGPAVVWSDGSCDYFINGNRMPKWLIETEAGKIDPKLSFTEKNVEVQREIIKKVGVERVLKSGFAEVVDVFNDPRAGGNSAGSTYTLYSIKLNSKDLNQDLMERKYLHFEHASLPGVFYAQPVHPSFNRAIHARSAILGIIPHSEEDIKFSDEELIKMMPEVVS